MSEKRELNIIFRVTEDEKELIELEAQRAGLPVGSFMRLLVKQYSDGIRFEKKNAE